MFALVAHALDRKPSPGFWLASFARHNDRRDVAEVIELAQARQVTRRSFLKATGAALVGAGTMLGGLPTISEARPKSDAKVVIVGGGVAGLNCAYKLKKAGLRAEIYEASTRTGGRMFTATDLMAPNLTTELGGEFVDSIHADILALAREFNLDLIDTLDPVNANLIPQAYYFDGQHYTDAQVVQAFLPLVPQIETDLNSLSAIVNFRSYNKKAAILDNTSIAEYLDAIGATGFLRKLLDVAYVTEYGLESDDQSTLNFLYLIGTDTANGFETFGVSDERYKILGGNQRVVDELAARLPGQIHTEHFLEAIQSRGRGFRLSFQIEGGATATVDADIVIMCIPFSILRDLDLRIELPGFKRRAIDELPYGTNAKVMAGFQTRHWRGLGFIGELFTDEGLQLGWDNSLQQGGTAGGLTFYSGGDAGIAVGQGTAADQVALLLPGAEKAFPGLTVQQNGNVARFHWPTFPLTMGSYSAYRTGQWTTIAGAEKQTVGNLYFAGEHCTQEFQGYMNGGAITGRLAAQAVLAKVR